MKTQRSKRTSCKHSWNILYEVFLLTGDHMCSIKRELTAIMHALKKACAADLSDGK